MNKYDNLLNSIYYDIKNPNSFSNSNVLYKEAKKIDHKINLKDVENWLKAQFTHTLHKQPRRKFKRNRIIVEDIDEVWEADLVDMQEFAKQNNNYKYMLTVIDSMSKFAFAIPIKNKKSQEIVKAFERIFKQRQPLTIRTDQGKEFLNKEFKKLLMQKNINHFTSKNKDIKCAIIERFNRTLKSKMFKYFTSKGTRKFIDVIDDIINNYNNSYHRTIKMTPNQASYENRELLFKNIYGTLKPERNKREIGEKIRKLYDQKPFDKGFYPNWTDQTFEISDKSTDQLPLFKIKNEKNEKQKQRFYSNQIQEVIIDKYRVEKILKKRKYKGKNQCLVKWLNYPPEYNSWINENELIQL